MEPSADQPSASSTVPRLSADGSVTRASIRPITRLARRCCGRRRLLRNIAHRCALTAIIAAPSNASTVAGPGSNNRCVPSTSDRFPPDDSSEAGHWEGDLIIGKDQQSAIGTLVERQTRYVRLLHLHHRDGETLHDALRARSAICHLRCGDRSNGTKGPRWHGTLRSPRRSERRSTSATQPHRVATLTGNDHVIGTSVRLISRGMMTSPP